MSPGRTQLIANSSPQVCVLVETTTRKIFADRKILRIGWSWLQNHSMSDKPDRKVLRILLSWPQSPLIPNVKYYKFDDSDCKILRIRWARPQNTMNPMTPIAKSLNVRWSSLQYTTNSMIPIAKSFDIRWSRPQNTTNLIITTANYYESDDPYCKITRYPMIPSAKSFQSASSWW